MASGAADAAAARPPGPLNPGASRASAAPPLDVHHDIARDIGQQVELMILESKRIAESKVGKEIQKINVKLEAMGGKIKMVSDRVARMEAGSSGLLKADLQKSIAKLEEVWEGEVGTLKHELWQTIQAHNHNADLLKHHKDAIDAVQQRVTDSGPNPEVEQVNAQLLVVDRVMQRELAQDQRVEQFKQRLVTVLQQWASISGGMPPPMGAMGWPQGPAVAAKALEASAAAQAATGKKTRGKASAKGKAKQPSTASAQVVAAGNLRVEAPEFVPMG